LNVFVGRVVLTKRKDRMIAGLEFHQECRNQTYLKSIPQAQGGTETSREKLLISVENSISKQLLRMHQFTLIMKKLDFSRQMQGVVMRPIPATVVRIWSCQTVTSFGLTVTKSAGSSSGFCAGRNQKKASPGMRRIWMITMETSFSCGTS